MRKRLFALLLTAGLAVAGGAEARDELIRTQSEGYTAGPEWYDCDGFDPPDGNHDGACFALSGDETEIDVSVVDDVMPSVGGTVQFMTTVEHPILVRDAVPVESPVPFCDSISGVNVPPGADRFFVSVERIFGRGSCGLLTGKPTFGTITVSFWR